ncbi:MAG TPA: AMP-binding protein [Verrucomicrobiae bacterium]|nr:AMP-binding protein [Verrucomicrobiae bacterium]
MDNLWSLLARNVRNFPHSVAVNYPAEKRSLTWLELSDSSFRLAMQLKGLGIVPGDKVAAMFPNCPEFITAFYAVEYLGAVFVPINIRLTSQEIAYILADCDAKILLFAEEKREVAEESQTGSADLKLLSGREFGQGVEALGEYLPSGLAQAGDTAEILYTSGTTGKPKGVMLTHYAVISVAQMMAYEAGIYPGDNLLLLMPLTHSAPLNLFMVGGSWSGATVTLGEFTPQNILNLTQNEKVTHFFAAPIAYQLISRMPDLANYDLSSMKYWIYGGAPAGREQVLAWQQALPGKFMSVYGLTEAGPNGMALRHQEHAGKAGSIGNRGSVNAEMKILRMDGSEAANGEEGEIALRSPSLMSGYYKKPDATAEAIKDGWLLTGDIARKDEDGYVWVLDRKKDMIISGGVNVYPKEVEDVLLTNPKILDAAVIGVPHADWGETVCAVVVIKPEMSFTQAELQEFCRGNLADYKIPKLLKVVPALPRNSSGKLLKFVLRKEVGG